MKQKSQYPKKNKYKGKISITKEQIQMYEGPIPHPDTLQKYEDIYPGFADRIIQMTEKQLEHRVSIENKVIDSKIKDSRLGMILGFILSFIIIIIGGFLIYKDKNGQGFSLIITSITSLVGCFLYATNSNKKERKQKDEENN